MNSCCTLPVEIIAADEHKMSGQCCLVTDTTPAPIKAECPVSKTLSHKVQLRTLEHLLLPELIPAIEKVQYYYCQNPTCPVVYFSNEHAPYFTTNNVNVKVFAKDKTDDVNVCYCFAWSRARIKDEISNTGKSTAAIQVAKEVRAGNCACDIKNPKGECCLGDINTYVKEIKSV